MARKLVIDEIKVGDVMETRFLANPVQEGLVLEIFVDDHIEHAQGKRGIGSGSEPQPHIGARSNASQTRINRDEFGSFCETDRKRFALVTIRIADHQIVAPDHDAFGIVFIVDNRICAAGDNTGGDTRAVAKVPGRKNIGAAQ